MEFKEPILSIEGNRAVCIENYKRILSFEETYIQLLCKGKQIGIIGCKLRILYYTKEEIKICGQICQIQFDSIKGA